MSVVYARLYLKRSQPGVYKFCTVCEQPAIDGQSVAAVTNKSKVPCVLKLEPSPLRLPMLHSGSSPALSSLSTKCTRTFNFREIFKRAFKIYGIWPQANTYVTNTLPQCSPTSVGLAQACPNNAQTSHLFMHVLIQTVYCTRITCIVRDHKHWGA